MFSFLKPNPRREIEKMEGMLLHSFLKCNDEWEGRVNSRNRYVYYYNKGANISLYENKDDGGVWIIFGNYNVVGSDEHLSFISNHKSIIASKYFKKEFKRFFEEKKQLLECTAEELEKLKLLKEIHRVNDFFLANLQKKINS